MSNPDQLTQDFNALARKHNADSIRNNHQRDLIHKANKVINFRLFNASFSLKLFKPKLNPDGICLSLVEEWYRYTKEQRDFFKALENADEDLLNRINFLLTYGNDNINVEINAIRNLNGNFTRDSLSDLFFKKMDLINLQKTHGLDCESICVQTNAVGKQNNITTQHKFRYADQPFENFNEDAEIQEKPVSSIDDFDKTILHSMNTEFNGKLKLIFLLHGGDSETNKIRSSHAIGVTSRINSTQAIEYLFYDPVFGEVKFNSFINLKNFLREYFLFQSEFASYENSSPHPFRYSNICIQTYNDGKNLKM